MDFIIIVVFAVCFIIFIMIATRKKSKLGLNFKWVYCPICNTKLPIIRIPANVNQFMFGGTTCPKCRTNLDKYGKVIS
jgi:hypothetical protein